MNIPIIEYVNKYIGRLQTDGTIIFNENLVNKYNKYHPKTLIQNENG